MRGCGVMHLAEKGGRIERRGGLNQGNWENHKRTEHSAAAEEGGVSGQVRHRVFPRDAAALPPLVARDVAPLGSGAELTPAARRVHAAAVGMRRERVLLT